MDTFDNNIFEPEADAAAPAAEAFSAPEEAAPQSESGPVQQPYTAEPPHRESPYANSPYASSPYASRQNSSYAYSYQPPRPAEPKAKPAGRGMGRSIVAGALAVALVAGSCGFTAFSVNRSWEARNAQTVQELNRKIDDLQQQIHAASRSDGTSISGSPVVSSEGLTPGQVYARNVESVVAISSVIQATMYGQTTQGTATGSGFILSEDGYVVTNYHVVEGATSIKVITHGGEEYEAKLIGTDSTNDVAVLKIETEGLPAVTIGKSEDLVIGDMVVAIGNPLGELTATQTVGYVSGMNREVTTDNTMINMIQTDAAINSGNSGGPLFNMKGEVVGITTAKYSGTTNSGASIEGIGFAIPIDDVENIIGDLRSYGYVTGAYLGVTVQNTDAASASLYGLPTGAYVASVVSGGAADRAGVQVKDIIIGLGDTEVGTVTELTRALRRFKAGDTTTITVIRAGQRVELTITLDEKPQDLNAPEQPAAAEMPQEGSYDEWFDYFNKFFGNGRG